MCRMFHMFRMGLFACAVLLGGCGAEVAGAAATAAALQAAQARQGKDQQQQIERQLGEALKAGEARASAAGQ